MRTQPIPLVGGSYADETRPWSQQDTVNLLPCMAEVEGTRSPSMLKTPPGLKPRVEIVGAPAVRGTYNCEGKLFAVIGQQLYQVSNAGIAIPIGQVPGIGRVEFAHNQISLGNELAVMTGQAGYVYNTVTQTFARITDPGFPGSAIGLFIDGYIIGIEPQGRYAFNSRPAAATEYNTLDRFTSEVSPDKLIGGAVSNNELLLLSATTGEFFENSGASQQPFRTKRITFDKGCAGPYTVVEADNSVFWLGSDGYFYRLNGYGPVRISKRPLEQAIRGLNWSQAFGFLWEDAGHTVVYWTFPDGRTWGFDAANGQWHRRASYGMNRWRVNSMTRWNDVWIAGDYQKGRLWEMDWNYILEGDDEFISERTIAVVHDHQNRVGVPRMELLMDTGQIETTPGTFPAQPEPPTISGAAPDGVQNEAYAGYQYTIAGTGSLRVTVHSGAPPTGVEISTSGLMNTDVTTARGTFTYTLRVTDLSTGLWAELTDSVVIVFNLTQWTAIPVDFGIRAFIECDQVSGIVAAVNYQYLDHAYSADGATFTITEDDPPIQCVGLAWSPSLELYATTSDAANNRYYTSPTGAAWTQQSGPSSLTGRRGMCWSPALGQFATVNESQLITSPNGTAWTSNERGLTGVERIAWSPLADGYITVGTDVYTSNSDGTSFTQRTVTGADYTDIAENDDTIVICCVSGVSVSPDGVTWTDHATPIVLTTVEWVPFLGVFVAAGYTTQVQVYSSPDGVTWTFVTPVIAPSDSMPHDISYSDENKKVYMVCFVSSVPGAGRIYVAG